MSLDVNSPAFQAARAAAEDRIQRARASAAHKASARGEGEAHDMSLAEWHASAPVVRTRPIDRERAARALARTKKPFKAVQPREDKCFRWTEHLTRVQGASCTRIGLVDSKATPSKTSTEAHVIACISRNRPATVEYSALYTQGHCVEYERVSDHLTQVRVDESDWTQVPAEILDFLHSTFNVKVSGLFV